MRIADTLLRGGHVSEDALADAWYTGVRPAHLDACNLCAERALELSRWLDETKETAVEAADAVFTPERLAAQQSQILRKLEHLDRPSKLLSFPRAGAGAPADLPLPVRHTIVPWIAVAAACLILGVVAGRLSVWQPAPTVQSAQVAPVAPQSPAPVADIREVEQYPGEISQPELNSLSALETMTPQVFVARASNATQGPRR